MSAEAGLAALASATLEVCVNDGCTTGTFASEAEAVPQFSQDGPANAKQSLVVTVEESGGWVRFELELSTYTPGAWQDGDVYHVRVVAASGDVLVDAEQAVDSYTETYPNGPDCDDEPCRSATIAL